MVTKRKLGTGGRGRKSARGYVRSGWFPASIFLASIGLLYLFLHFNAPEGFYSIFGFLTFLFFASFLPKMMHDTKKEVAQAAALAQANMDARQKLIVEAYHHAGVLARARAKLPDLVSATVEKLHAHTKAILKIIGTNWHEVTPIVRFFTYYLPETTHLVTARLSLSPQMNAERLNEIDATLARLVEAFAAFEAAARAPDLESIDLDIRLLDQALKTEIDGLRVS
jgi:hypothetical protein